MDWVKSWCADALTSNMHLFLKVVFLEGWLNLSFQIPVHIKYDRSFTWSIWAVSGIDIIKCIDQSIYFSKELIGEWKTKLQIQNVSELPNELQSSSQSETGHMRDHPVVQVGLYAYICVCIIFDV